MPGWGWETFSSMWQNVTQNISRGGASHIFSSPRRAWAFSKEPAVSQSFLLKRLYMWSSSLLQASLKIGSLSLEPRAYLLRAKIRPGSSSPSPGSFHLKTKDVKTLFSHHICDAAVTQISRQRSFQRFAKKTLIKFLVAKKFEKDFVKPFDVEMRRLRVIRVGFHFGPH